MPVFVQLAWQLLGYNHLVLRKDTRAIAFPRNTEASVFKSKHKSLLCLVMAAWYGGALDTIGFHSRIELILSSSSFYLYTALNARPNALHLANAVNLTMPLNTEKPGLISRSP